MENEMVTVKLTVEEWQEVYYAIGTKQCAIERGDYGPDDDELDTCKWVTDLGRIAEKISRRLGGNV